MMFRNAIVTAGFVTAIASSPVAARAQQPVQIPYDALATRIVTALQVSPGERVLLRYDPTTLGPLEAVVRQQLLAKGAVVETLDYGPAPDLQRRLDATDIYIWLPAGASAATPAEQRLILAKWLDDGKGRQIHFHWGGGTVDPDGRAGVHSEAFDRLYIDALDIDYADLSARQDRAITTLRAGEVRVTTPAGTDIRFQVGDRPFNKQDGDASKARTDKARTRVDREIELPAGVIRVAPIETTVNGVLVVAEARLLESAKATGIRLEFERGALVRATADSGADALHAYLASSPTLPFFRELGLGFNARLVQPEGSRYFPYYGYGDAVVRLSLGDNTELAGNVRGGASRWLFFGDATITAGDTTLVSNGRLAEAYR